MLSEISLEVFDILDIRFRLDSRVPFIIVVVTLSFQALLARLLGSSARLRLLLYCSSTFARLLLVFSSSRRLVGSRRRVT